MLFELEIQPRHPAEGRHGRALGVALRHRSRGHASNNQSMGNFMKKSISEQFGEYLCGMRLQSQLSVRALAKRAKVSSSLISAIENGRRPGGPLTEDKLVAALGLQAGLAAQFRGLCRMAREEQKQGRYYGHLKAMRDALKWIRDYIPNENPITYVMLNSIKARARVGLKQGGFR